MPSRWPCWRGQGRWQVWAGCITQDWPLRRASLCITTHSSNTASARHVSRRFCTTAGSVRGCLQGGRGVIFLCHRGGGGEIFFPVLEKKKEGGEKAQPPPHASSKRWMRCA